MLKILLQFIFLNLIFSCNADIVTDIMTDINNGKVNDGVIKLETYAKEGNSDAQYQLGMLYYNGVKVSRSYTLALEYFLKSGKNDNTEAQLRIADMYLNGKGTFWNKSEAIKWYEKASINSNYAKYLLGKSQIDYISAGSEKGVDLLIQAGDAGIADAYCLLGRFYWKRTFSGFKKEGDEDKTYEYFSKAADLNDIEGLHMKGVFTKDYKEKISLFRKSSEYGNGSAFYSIYDSCIYKYDTYKEYVSRIEIYKSLLLACRILNYEISSSEEKEIAKFNFTKEEIEEATRQANEWKPKPLLPQPVVK